MSDDLLDDILDSVEMSDLESNLKGDIDLDDILDSVCEEISSTKSSAVDSGEYDIDMALQSRLEHSEMQPWIKALSTFPAELKAKWFNYVQLDFKTDESSIKFLSSPAYRSWYGGDIESNTLKKSTLDCFRTVCISCGFDDTKTRAILAAITLPNGEIDPEVERLFGLELLRVHKDSLLNDLNYRHELFPDLSIVLNSI